MKSLHLSQREFHNIDCQQTYIDNLFSYNPEHYPDNEVPTTVMANDLLTTYKYGWKTSYYQNTYDAKKDGDDTEVDVDNLINDILNSNEEESCDSCAV